MYNKLIHINSECIYVCIHASLYLQPSFQIKYLFHIEKTNDEQGIEKIHIYKEVITCDERTDIFGCPRYRISLIAHTSFCLRLLFKEKTME